MSENVGLMLQGTGAGFSAGASIQAGKYQKQVADYNAAVADMQAQDALLRGRVAENRQRAIGRQMVGAQRAAMGAQGQDPNDPDSSAIDVQLDTTYLNEIDALTIRTNAAREAWGYQVSAQDSRARGQIAELEGQQRAVGTLLGTAGNALLMKYGFRNPEQRPGQYSLTNRQYG